MSIHTISCMFQIQHANYSDMAYFLVVMFLVVISLLASLCFFDILVSFREEIVLQLDYVFTVLVDIVPLILNVSFNIIKQVPSQLEVWAFCDNKCMQLTGMHVLCMLLHDLKL